jgi:hypothetical protein
MQGEKVGRCNFDHGPSHWAKEKNKRRAKKKKKKTL